jgi:hypothetical protein
VKYVTRVQEMRNPYNILVGKHEADIHLKCLGLDEKLTIIGRESGGKV